MNTLRVSGALGAGACVECFSALGWSHEFAVLLGSVVGAALAPAGAWFASALVRAADEALKRRYLGDDREGE